MDGDTMGAYKKLRDAIIMQAVKDIRDANKTLKKHPHSKTAAILKQNALDFIGSDWFYELSGVDGNVILEKIKKEETA
jgi:hypothetical protein